MKLSHAASTTLTAIAELHAPIGVGSGAVLGCGLKEQNMNTEIPTPRTDGAEFDALENQPHDGWRKTVKRLADKSREIETECEKLRQQIFDDAEYVKIGKRWRANNSLEEWFPFSAEKLEQLTARVAEWEKRRYKKSLMLARKFADAVGQTDEEKICLMAAQIAEDLAA